MARGRIKKQKVLGAKTVVKPCLIGAGVLYVVQFAMRAFLKA